MMTGIFSFLSSNKPKDWIGLFSKLLCVYRTAKRSSSHRLFRIESLFRFNEFGGSDWLVIPLLKLVKSMITRSFLRLAVQTVKLELFGKFLVDRLVGVFRVKVRTDTAQTYANCRLVVLNATSPQAR